MLSGCWVQKAELLLGSKYHVNCTLKYIKHEDCNKFETIWNIFKPPSQPDQSNLRVLLPRLEPQVAQSTRLRSGRYCKDMPTSAGNQTGSKNGFVSNGTLLRPSATTSQASKENRHHSRSALSSIDSNHDYITVTTLIFSLFSALQRFPGEAMLASTKGWSWQFHITIPAGIRLWLVMKAHQLTFETSFPIFRASWSHAIWDIVVSICWIGRSWASHPLKPPSSTTTRCLDGQLFLKKLATLLLWFSPPENVAFECFWRVVNHGKPIQTKNYTTDGPRA